MLIKKDKLIGNKGQTLVEALVAIGVFLVGINAIIFLLFAAQSIFVDTTRNQEALNYASDGIEAIKSIRDRSWDELTDGEHGLLFSNNQWTFSGTSDSKNNLTRKIIITTQNGDIKDIKSIITWQTNPLNPRTLQTEEVLTRWRDALASKIAGGGDDGGSSPTGDWLNPRTLTSIDVGAGNEATDVDVYNNTVYISTQASSRSKPDIHAFDISNPAAPSLLDSYDVDAYALVSIDYNGDYVYGASTGVIPDLKVVDAHDPANLSLASEFNVITFVNAKSVLKMGTTVYLGVQKTAVAKEFFAIDATNPLTLSQIDDFEINGDINKISVKDNLAYLATSRDDRELFILNVTDPANISQAGYLDISGSADANSVFVQSASRVFLGAGNVFYALDATDPLNVSVIGSLDAGGTINDIYVAGNLAFLATSNSNKEFQVVSISNPASPTLYSFFNFPQVATGVDYKDNIIYVSVRSNDGLRIITSAP